MDSFVLSPQSSPIEDKRGEDYVLNSRSTHHEDNNDVYSSAYTHAEEYLDEVNMEIYHVEPPRRIISKLSTLALPKKGSNANTTQTKDSFRLNLDIPKQDSFVELKKVACSQLFSRRRQVS